MYRAMVTYQIVTSITDFSEAMILFKSIQNWSQSISLTPAGLLAGNNKEMNYSRRRIENVRYSKKQRKQN